MKRKWFFEPGIVYVCGPILCGSILLFIFLVYDSCREIFLNHSIKYCFYLPFCLLLVVGSIWVYRNVLGPRLDWIKVTSEYVDWHCFLKRKRRLYYRDCTYIDIETFNKEAQCDIIRGDECAMIYFSTKPYPEDKRGRINHVNCNNDFIKFWYSDKLAETLLNVIPEEKSIQLRVFYEKMQYADRQMERKRRYLKASKKRKSKKRK